MLKCLKAELRKDSLYQQMLRKEFEILMSLQHPAVLQAFGIEPVALPDGSTALCIVAEWIDGDTLDTYLTTNPSRQERRRIATELAEALAYIHSQQIVHRDLKPQNLMVTHNGHYLKIIDFGLADTDNHAILKQPAGTLKYMSPEQAQRAAPDVRNDIYSLGIILGEMQLGHIYNKVVERCQRPIHQRYQNMDELLADLRARPRRRGVWAAVGLSALAVVAALIAQIHTVRQQAADLEAHTEQLNLQLKVLNHEIIGFADPHAKRLCLQNWDTDHDGQLSYVEAAAVPSLGNTFTGDTLLREFPELEHFTGLADIGPNAFWGCTRLHTVRLPRTIRYIRQNAFRQTALRQITIPSSVAAIGDHILDDCTSLETVIFESTLPNTNTGSRQFENCPRLSTIFVPEYWTSADPAKASWQQLARLITRFIHFRDPAVKAICIHHWDKDGNRELTIDEAMDVKSLGAAFSDNQAITSFDELRFFTGLTEIDASTFERCIHLQSVRLPATLQTIGENAFLACDLRKVHIPAATTRIASTAFGSDWHLAEVVVSPDNPVYDSRDGCNAIVETATNRMITGSTTAFIPRSVSGLSDECFNWFNRPELTLPAQITHIGLWSLTSIVGRVYCESPTPPTFDSQDGQAYLFPPASMGFPEPEIYVPIGSLDAYRQAEGWSLFADRIREYPAPAGPHRIDFPAWSAFGPKWTDGDSWKMSTFVAD